MQATSQLTRGHIDIGLRELLRSVVREEIQDALANTRPVSDTDEYLSQQDVSERYQISVYSLARWRATGEGPRFYRMGRRIRYARSDIEAWLRETLENE